MMVGGGSREKGDTFVEDVTRPRALDAALSYRAAGWSPLPLHGITPAGTCTCSAAARCKSPGKHPLSNEWQNQTLSVPDLHSIWEQLPAANVGIRTGAASGIFVVDVDAAGLEPMRRMIEAHGKDWPRTTTVQTGSGMWHFYFLIPQGVRITNSSKGLPAGVDIRGEGGQVVAPPSVSLKGSYAVTDNSPVAPPPAWLTEILAAQSHDDTPLMDGPVVKRPPTASEAMYERNLVGKQLERLGKLKGKPWAEGDAWDQTCFEVACHLIEMANAEFSTLTHEDAYRRYMEAAPRDDVWDERHAKWASAMRASGNKAKVDNPMPTLDDMAGGAAGAAFLQAAPVESQEVLARIGEQMGGIEIVGAEGAPTDATIIARFCRDALFGRAVFSRELKTWMIWDGQVWSEGSVHDIREMFRRWVWAQQEAAADEEVQKFWAKYAQVSKLKNVPELSTGIMSVRHSVFDRHPDLLVVGNGTVNLRTGELGGFDPAHLMTRRTEVDYDPQASSPDWQAVLSALPPEVGDWMQIRFGQAATGLTPPDDTLIFCKGSGANAKTTMLDAVRRALGSYAVVVSEKVLLGSVKDHPTEMTDLQGARMALLEELPENGHLTIKRLKNLVGTDQMTARRLYSNSISWEPTHTLFVTTNYTPVVTEADHGTWRRLAMVTFPYRYVDNPVEPNDRKADPGLRQRMKDATAGQLQAVLAWLVAGAVRWYANGELLHRRPDRVMADTADWRGESDAIFAYATERVEPDPAGLVVYRELYEDFTAWLAARGQTKWSERLFTERLVGHAALPGATRTRRRSLEGVSRRPGNFSTDVGGGAPVHMVAGLRFREGIEPVSTNVVQMDEWVGAGKRGV